jgi:bacillithiol system protein YtxJ
MNPTPTARTFTQIEGMEHVAALLQESQTRPVVVFKHSPTCGTSAHAYDEMAALIEEADGPEVYLVDVLHSRSLSQAIAAALHVRHESPQVLVLSGGSVRWQASHYRVTAEAVRNAVAASRTPPPDR